MGKLTFMKNKNKLDRVKRGPNLFLKVAIIWFCIIFLCFEASAMIDLIVTPTLVSNNGTDKVKFSYYIDTKFELAEYKITISNESTVIYSILKKVNDTMPGESSPTIGSFDWPVPRDQAKGLYVATLELGTRYDLPPSLYSEPFVITDEEEVAKLKAEKVSVLTEKARLKAIEEQAQLKRLEAETQRKAEQEAEAERQIIAEQDAEAQKDKYLWLIFGVLGSFIAVLGFLRKRGVR